MKRIRLHVQAERELAEAFDFYEQERPGMGVRFARAVRAKLDAVVRLPGIARMRKIGRQEVRCAALRRFPYVLFFVQVEDGLFLVALAHTNRDPAYWLRRLGS